MQKSETFWKAHSKSKPTKDYFSQEFKTLIISMLSLDPNSRPTMDEIMENEWVNGETPSEHEVKKEFRQRNESVVAAMEAEKAEHK